MNPKKGRHIFTPILSILLPFLLILISSKSLASSINQEIPTIDSVTLNKNLITDGGKITLTIRAQSIAPVDWLNHSLYGPLGCLHGGGIGTTFTEISPGIWEKQRPEIISEWAPSGVYTYSNISVENEAQLQSEIYPPITFTVNNSNSSQPPVIQSAFLNTNEIKDGGKITLTIRAQSIAPVDWLNHSLFGPLGCLHGGGIGTTFTEISPGVWEKQKPETISEWAPSGVYTYSNISVENEAQLQSEIYPPITFTVKNGAQAIIDPINGGSLIYTNSDGNSTIINIPPGAVTKTTEIRYMPIPSVIPPDGFSLVGKHKFMLSTYDNGNYIPDYRFRYPISLTVHYNDNDLLGIDESSIILTFLNGDSWEDVINTCSPPSSYERNADQNWIRVSICHLTDFALLSDEHKLFSPLIFVYRK